MAPSGPVSMLSPWKTWSPCFNCTRVPSARVTQTSPVMVFTVPMGAPSVPPTTWPVACWANCWMASVLVCSGVPVSWTTMSPDRFAPSADASCGGFGCE